MKFPSLRSLLKILVLLIVLVLLLIASCIRLVDRRPYQKSKYYKSTLEYLEKATNALPPPSLNKLFVGAGKAGITPPVGIPLAGYSDRKGKPSTGVNDSLFVRTIALQSGERLVCIIGYDALYCHPPIARIIEDSAKSKFNLEAKQLLFTATHTHSGPGGWGHGWVEEQFAGPPDTLIGRIFVDSTLVAMKRALSCIEPASYRTGSLKAPHYIHNRLVGDKGEVDTELVYIVFSRDEKIIAVIATYSAHATVLSARNMLFSGDYPGYFDRKIESEVGGTVIFAAAGVASHSHRGQGKDFEKAQYIGNALADSLLLHLDGPQIQSTNLTYFRFSVDNPDLQIRISENLRLAPWLARRILHIYDSYMQVVALDRFLIIGSPGEFSGELALLVKEHAETKDFQTTITSFNGCYLGYVTPSKYYYLKNYETRLMSFFGPYTGDYFTDIMKRVVDKVLAK